MRGVGGEFRYNVVLHAGHQWLWADTSDAAIHHNLFVGGNADVGGIMVIYDPMNVTISNNTFDGLLDHDVVTFIKLETGSVSLNSNAFLNAPNAPAVSIEGGMLSADYNLFFNPQPQNYSDDRMPGHDVAAGAETDPMLTDPPAALLDLDEAAIWKRTTQATDLLATYRQKYTPKAGSPLIDSGDPAGGVGNDIGAVGAGQPNAADKLGVF